MAILEVIISPLLEVEATNLYNEDIRDEASEASYIGISNFQAQRAQSLHQSHKSTRLVLTEYFHKELISIYLSHFHLWLTKFVPFLKLINYVIKNPKSKRKGE